MWVSSWNAALCDPGLGAGHARTYAASRDTPRERVAAAQEPGEPPPGDPALVAAGAQSFTLGLVVRALFDPAAFPPRRQAELLDDCLACLAVPRPTGDAPAIRSS